MAKERGEMKGEERGEEVGRVVEEKKRLVV